MSLVRCLRAHTADLLSHAAHPKIQRPQTTTHCHLSLILLESQTVPYKLSDLSWGSFNLKLSLLFVCLVWSISRNTSLFLVSFLTFHHFFDKKKSKNSVINTLLKFNFKMFLCWKSKKSKNES